MVVWPPPAVVLKNLAFEDCAIRVPKREERAWEATPVGSDRA